MGRVVKLKPGESHPHTLSVLEVQRNSAKVADHGRVIGWFKRGDWVSGNEGWGGVKVISIGPSEVVFHDSRIFLIP